MTEIKLTTSRCVHPAPCSSPLRRRPGRVAINPGPPIKCTLASLLELQFRPTGLSLDFLKSPSSY